MYYYEDPVSKQRHKSHSSSCPPSQKMHRVLSWWELRASLGFILNCCSCTQMHCGYHSEWLVLLPHTFHLPACIVCELSEGRGLVSCLVYHPEHLRVHAVTPAGSAECSLCARYCSSMRKNTTRSTTLSPPKSPTRWTVLSSAPSCKEEHRGMKWSHLPKVTQLPNSKARVWTFESTSSCLCS